MHAELINKIDLEIPEFAQWKKSHKKDSISSVIEIFQFLRQFYLESYAAKELQITRKTARLVDELVVSNYGRIKDILILYFLGNIDHQNNIQEKAFNDLGPAVKDLLEKFEHSLPSKNKFIDKFIFVDLDCNDAYRKSVEIDKLASLMNSFSLIEVREFHDWFNYSNPRLQLSVPFDEDSKLVQKIFLFLYAPLNNEDISLIGEIMQLLSLRIYREKTNEYFQYIDEFKDFMLKHSL